MAGTKIEIVLAIIFTLTEAKKYVETIQTNSGNYYDENESSYHQGVSQHLYQVKPAKEYVFQATETLPLNVEPTQKPTFVLKTSDTGKRIVLSSPHSNYVAGVAGNTEYYPYPYTAAKAVLPTTGSVVPVIKTASHIHQYSKEENKKYKYGYRVTDPHHGAEFGHSEDNDGHIAKGYYHVLLPDGRLQNVKYWAGDSGFNAVITYEK